MSPSELGSKGGKARAAALSPERKTEIARNAANARWKNKMITTDKLLDETMFMTMKSGSFQGSIEVPVNASAQDKRTFIDSWMAYVEAGIKMQHSTTVIVDFNVELLAKAIFDNVVARGAIVEGCSGLVVHLDGAVDCIELADRILKTLKPKA